MHAYVHCGTVYNREDLEPTQMPIDDKVNIVMCEFDPAILMLASCFAH